MRTPLLLAALFALAASAAAAQQLAMANGYGALDAARDVSPQQLGEMFCAARISGDMAPLAPFFADKLVKLLGEATATNTPVSWQALPGRPDTCAISVVNGYDDTIGVLVAVAYTADTQHWTDTLNLERTPQSWRLNNVFYEGGGNLRFRLLGALP